MKRGFSTFLMIVLASFVMVVACSRPHNKAVVTKVAWRGRPAQAAQRVALQCRALLHGTSATVGAGSDGAAVHTVSICKFPEADLDQAPDVPTEGPLPNREDWFRRGLQYRVDPGSRGTPMTIHLDLAIVFADKTIPCSDRVNTVKWINGACANRIEGLWNPSVLSSRLEVAAYDFDASSDSCPPAASAADSDHPKVGQEIVLVSDSRASTPQQRLVRGFYMRQWPNRARVFPYAKKLANNQSGRSSRSVDLDSNRRFCQDLAVLVGSFLGLQPSEKNGGSCQSPPASSSTVTAAPAAASAPQMTIAADSQPSATPAPTDDDVSSAEPSADDADDASDLASTMGVGAKSFMEAAQDPDRAPRSFWSTVRFSPDDSLKVLEPVCTQVMPRPTPTPAPHAPAPGRTRQPGTQPTPGPTPASPVDDNSDWG